MSEKWRLIDSGFNNAYYNMALDEAVLRSAISGDSPPTFRFYGWQPAAVSLGYAQDIGKGLNLAACQRRGLDIVRRLTGGRAVLHQHELTYCIIVPLNFFKETGVLASYRIIAGALIQGLSYLGLELRLVAGRTGDRANKTANCFASPSWYEITVKNRKIIGSAQRRIKSHIMQQGSVLLDINYSLLAELFENEKTPLKQMISQAQSKMAGLNEFADKKISISQLKQEMIKGFSKSLGIEFVKAEPYIYEIELGKELAEQKYSNLNWNFNRQAG